MKSLLTCQCEDIVIFLVLITSQITSGVNVSHRNNLNSRAIVPEKEYFNMLKPKQMNKSVSRSEITPVFRRESRSIPHYLHKHLQQLNWIHRKEKDLLKQKRQNKNRKQYILYSSRNSYNTQSLVTNFRRNVFSKAIRNNKNSKTERRLRKKFRHQKLFKEKLKELKENNNFHNNQDHSKLFGSYMEDKYEIKDNRKLSNVHASLVPRTIQKFLQRSKQRRQNHKHNRLDSFHVTKHENTESHKRNHKVKDTIMKKNSHLNLKVGRHNHQHFSEKDYRSILSKNRPQYYTRIANFKRKYKFHRQHRDRQITEKRRLSNKKARKRKHLNTSCHYNCLNVLLRMKTRPPKQNRKVKHTITLKKRIQTRKSHPKNIFRDQDDRTNSFYKYTKHKQKYFYLGNKNKMNRMKGRKSGYPNVSGEHRPKYDKGKHINEDQNKYKKRNENESRAKTNSFKKDSTRGVLCEDSKAKIREIIIKMNKAVKRSMILAKIIGEKFGIDDKTIESILMKEEEKISSSVLHF